MNRQITLIFISLLFLYSCRESTGGIISDIPEISFEEITPNQVKAGEDEITFFIKYTDGDGDLGTNDDNVRNVFLTDLRIGAVQEFRLQQLAPDGAEVPITGTFNLKLPFTIMVDSAANSEKVSFSLYVTDRAGNESNTIESEEITVIP
ncbi:MAG: hypothetical protein AAFY71_28470 [Bacteroidota bacterium]